MHQDAARYATRLSEGKSVEHEVRPGRRARLQVAHGWVTLNGTALDTGDGAALTGESRLALHGMKDAEVVVFNLARR